jgi:hypothetical protein
MSETLEIIEFSTDSYAYISYCIVVSKYGTVLPTDSVSVVAVACILPVSMTSVHDKLIYSLIPTKFIYAINESDSLLRGSLLCQRHCQEGKCAELVRRNTCNKANGAWKEGS